MNYLDIIILIPLLWAGFRGFKRGLVIELASLASLGLGIYGAIKFSDYVAVVLNENVEVKKEFLPLLAFSLTFIAIVIGVYFLGKWIEKLVNMIALKILNKLAGMVFSIARFALILSVIMLILETADEKLGILPKQSMQEAVLYQPIAGFAPMVIPAIKNSELFEEIKKSLEELDLNFENHEQN
jgi:membrane protein required for colicin V production